MFIPLQTPTTYQSNDFQNMNVKMNEFTPKMINGVTASKVFIETKTQSFKTLFAYLCDHFPHIDSAEWSQRFQDQLIIDQKGNALTIESPLITNTHIYYYRFLAHEVHVPFQEKILFENDDLLVVDKPHFLTISPSGKYVQETLLVRLKNTTGNAQLTPIHRLDRETAGIVLFSKRMESRGAYQQMFAQRDVQKTYHAIAPFHADLKFPCEIALRMEKSDPFYTMQITEGEINSETAIALLAHNADWAKYSLKPKTGKQHQLRVHLNYLNIPIKNDPFYPKVMHKAEDDFTQPLQLLAKELQFIDPITKLEMYFCSHHELTL